MIRPVDLQATLFSAQHAPAAVQRAQEGPRIDAQAAQAAFAAELTHREEKVAPASESAGNRIDAKPDQPDHDRDARKRKRKATPFEQVVDEAAGEAEEPPHLIDFTA